MSIRDMLPPNNGCEHSVVRFDDEIRFADNSRTIQAGCEDCGSSAFESGPATGTFIADLER